MLSPKVVEHFWLHCGQTNPQSCWDWTGAKTGDYGHIGHALLAHRVSWEIHNGEIPRGTGYHGTCVLHNCDNPPCVNPAHLRLGSHHDNMRDIGTRNRNRHPRKLSYEQAETIRCLYASGVTGAEIAKRFDVTKQAVSLIWVGRSWKRAS